MTKRPPPIALPCGWPKWVNSALLHAMALAQLGLTELWGRRGDGRARWRLVAEVERLRAEVAMLREELRIKDARMGRIESVHRPHYRATERLQILELKAARGWNQQQAADRFLVSAATIGSWLQRLDEQGPGALVKTPTPVNRFPDFVAHLVQRVKSCVPAMGKVRIAQLLARAGLRLSATTAGRMLKRPPTGGSPDGREPFAASQALGGRTPVEVYDDAPAHAPPRFEPRARLPEGSRSSATGQAPGGPSQAPPKLVVSYLEQRRHLPIVELREAP